MSETHKAMLMPTELRTAELARLPVWVRERAFFMAAVDRGEVLDAFATRMDRIVAGDLTVQEARQELHDELDKLGYAPQPGQEGTIKDLQSVRRMNVSLETNVAQVQGYARWARQQQALGGFPAQQFVRLRMSKVPRGSWPQRFADAVAATSQEGANIGAMAALVNHPCWVRLSTFGTPYAPFDYNSGMGIEALDRGEAESLGLLPGEDAGPEHAEMMRPQSRGLNESLESRPAIGLPRVRMAVSQALQGFAEWEGKTLRFTDPNGTRPYTAAELDATWAKPLPEGFDHLQKEAFVDWVSDHEDFKKKNATDRWEDLQRVHARLVNEKTPETLYRGMAMAREDLEGLLKTLEKQGYYSVRPEMPMESWTASTAAANLYARTGGKGWRVIVEAPKPDGSLFKDVSPLVRSLAPEIRKRGNPPVQTESEWLLRTGAKFSYRIKKDQDARLVRVVLGEEAR